jgi:3-oxoacyl-[acyl-carrier protein] reductase
MKRLEGKTALITGAGKGLGANLARRFAEQGATVIINDLVLEDARSIAREVRGHAVAADVSNSASVAAMFAEIAGFSSQLDILVNNAGISGVDPAEIGELSEKRKKQADELAATGKISTFIDRTVSTSDEAWRRIQAVHVDGSFFCCREALKMMNARMTGSIINMASVVGTSGRGPVPYATAKAAILGLTRSLANEVALRGIRVNAIAPGWIETDMTAPFRQLLKDVPFGVPDDVAWAAVYLASDETKFMTGQVIAPNGGFYMSQ